MAILIAAIVLFFIFGIPLTLMALGAFSLWFKWSVKNPPAPSNPEGV